MLESLTTLAIETTTAHCEYEEAQVAAVAKLKIFSIAELMAKLVFVGSHRSHVLRIRLLLLSVKFLKHTLIVCE